MKQLRIWLGKILGLQIILGREQPRPDLTIVYIVRLGDVLMLWGPALALAGFAVFYAIMQMQ